MTDTVLHESSTNVERCFSCIYYLLAGRGKQPLTNKAVGNVACAMIGIYTPDQQTIQVKANADTGGSKNLASKHLLQNVKTAEEYGNKPMLRTDQPQSNRSTIRWCVPKPEPVTQDHHRQTNDLKGSAINVYRLRDKRKRE